MLQSKDLNLMTNQRIKLPEEIQLLITKLLSPSKWKKINEMIEAMVEQTINAHETKFKIFAFTRLFKKYKQYN